MEINMKDDETTRQAMDDATMEGFTDLVTKMLETCIDDGMEVPLTLVAIDVNGSVLITHYLRNEDDDELEARSHLRQLYDSPFETPVNILVVDAAGEGEHALFDPNCLLRNKPLKTHLIHSELLQ